MYEMKVLENMLFPLDIKPIKFACDNTIVTKNNLIKKNNNSIDALCRH